MVRAAAIAHVSISKPSIVTSCEYYRSTDEVSERVTLLPGH